MWKTTQFLGNERETVGIPEIFHPLEQKKKEFLDADSKFKNILISFFQNCRQGMGIRGGDN